MLRSRQVALAARALSAEKGASTSLRGFQTSRRSQKREERDNRASSSKAKGKDDSDPFFSVAPSTDETNRHRSQYNVDPFSPRPTMEHLTFPLVTAATLARSGTRPRNARMLTRDFIHDSLYNPHYGYFSRHAVLLPDGAAQDRSYDFSSFQTEEHFMAAVEKRYTEFEDSLQDQTKTQIPESKHLTFSRQGLEAAQSRGRLDVARQLQSEKEAGEHDANVKAMAAKQVWHTPTELFKPHYAHALARYMVEANAAQGEGVPLRVYEVGAGSGALAVDVLGYLAEHHPDVYQRTTYHIIEISPRLASQQASVLRSHTTAGKCRITNQSILDYTHVETEPCFFIALEVLDNLAHDVVRYSTDTLQPFQAIVSIDSTGDMHELWEPLEDELIIRSLGLLQAQNPSKLPITAPKSLGWLPSPILRMLTEHMPFYPNLTPPLYLPTGCLQLLDVLAARFPKHKAIISDFHSLPEALQGVNAPVVQTRLEGSMIPVTTYTVQQGFFDIFFPTNFAQLQYAHAQVTKRDPSSALVLDHGSFLSRYANVDKTSCKDGSNPMLSWYANASWFLS